MRLIVDANILVAELLRTKGKELVADERLELFVAAKAWEESQYELAKRVDIIAKQGQLSKAVASELFVSAINLAEQKIIVAEEVNYLLFKAEALSRVPNDPDDWHTVALALSLKASIWTQDRDFLGCGVATWTSETLKRQLMPQS